MTIEGTDLQEEREAELANKPQHPLVTITMILGFIALVVFGLANGANDCSHASLNCGPNGYQDHGQRSH